MDKLQLLLDVTLNKQSGQKELQKLQDTFARETLSLNIELNQAGLDKAIQQMKNVSLEADKELTPLAAIIGAKQPQLEVSLDDSDISRQINMGINQNTQALAAFSSQLAELVKQLNTISKIQFDALHKQFSLIQKSAEGSKSSTQSFIDEIMSGIIKLNQWKSAIDNLGKFKKNSPDSISEKYNVIDENSFNSFKNSYFMESGLDWDNVAAKYKNLDEAALSYFKTVSNGQYTYDGYIAHLKTLNTELAQSQNSFSLAALGAGLLNTALVTGVSMAINFAIKKFQEYKNEQELALQASEKVLSKYRQLYSDFESAKATVDDVADRYEILSQKVGKLGDITKLTADEQSEYLNIVNRIATTFPELVQGYRNEDQAILKVTDSVNELTEAYKRKEQAAYDSIITEGKTVTEKSIKRLNGNFLNPGLDAKYNTYEKVLTLLEDEDALLEYIRSYNGANEFGDSMDNRVESNAERQILRDLFKTVGISQSTYSKTAEDLIGNKAVITSYFADVARQINDDIQDNRQIANVHLNTDAEYQELDASARELASRLLNSPPELLKGKTNNEIITIVSDIIKNIGDKSVQDEMNKLYSLDTKSITKNSADELRGRLSGVYDELDISHIIDFDSFVDSAGFSFINDYYDSLQQVQEKFASGTDMNNPEEYLQEFLNMLETLSPKELQWMIELDFDKEATEENLNTVIEDMHQAVGPQDIQTYDFEFIGKNKDSVNNLLGDISTIQSAITTLTSGSYSSSDLLTSIQTFSGLLDGLKNKEGIDISAISSVSDLSDAFQELSEQYLAEFLEEINVDPDSDLGQMLANIANEAKETDSAFADMSLGIAAIQKSYNTLTTAMEEYNESGYITLDTLQNLLSLDGEYLDCLIDENGQLQLNSDTYAQMVALRLDEAEAIAIQQAITELHELQQRKEKDATEDYSHSVETLQTKLAGLAGSYDIVTDAALKSGAAQDLANKIEGGTAVDEAETKRIIDNLNSTLTLINGTRANLGSSLGSVMNGKSSSSSSSGSSAKVFNDEINWAEQSIKNLNNALSSLQAKLNDVHLSYEDQAKILAEVSDKQKTLADAYASATALYESEWNRLKALIPEEYVIKITTNNDFSMTTFTDENLYKAVKAAADAYDTYIDTLDKAGSANQSYADSLINLYNAQQTHLSNEITLLNNAQESIQNAINISETLDRLNTEKQYRQLIAYSKQQQELYIQKLNTAKAQLETISDKTSDRYYEIRNEIQECESAISSCVQEQLKWTQTIMELPIQQLQRVNQELQNSLSTLQKQQSQYDQAMKGVIAALDEEISKIEEARKAEEDYYNQLITDKQDELNTLQETNNERRIQLELEKAQYAFEQAKKQKSIRILRNGEFIYEADQSAIKDAKDSLDTALYNKQVDELNNSITDLQNQLDTISDIYQEQIDELNIIKDAWNDVAASVERLHNMKLADSLFGNDWRELLLAGDDRDLNYVTMLYGTNAENQKALEQQIEINNELIQQIEDYVAAWKAGEISISEALEGISETVEDTDGEILAAKRRIQSTDEYAANWDTANLQIQAALADLTFAETESADTEKTIFDQRILDMNDFAAQYANICQIIAQAAKSMIAGLDEAVTAAESAVAKLERLAAKAEAARNTINDAKSSSHSGTTPNGSGNIPKYHTGIENGLIASSSAKTNEEKALHYLATNKLAKNEVPIIAMKGEAIFTPNQVDTFLSNFSTASQQVNVIPQFVNDFTPHDVSQIEQNTEINVQFGDLSFPHVTTVEDFARDMETKFPLILRQVAARKQ